MFLPPGLQAQTSDWTVVNSSPPQALSRNQHTTEWQFVQTLTHAETGQSIERTNRFTEIASGLNYRDENGQWQPTEERFEALDNGGFVARWGPHKLILAPDANTPGAVELWLNDEDRLTSHVLALAYYDPVDGENLILSELKDTSAQKTGENTVVYPLAFEGIEASLRYTYHKYGISQDVILHEVLPDPEALGLSSSTRLEVYTEFLEDQDAVALEEHAIVGETDPDQRAEMVEPDLTDRDIDFGTARMGRGVAFKLEGNEKDMLRRVPVGKDYSVRPDGRKILIEAVRYKDLEPLMEGLQQGNLPIDPSEVAPDELGKERRMVEAPEPRSKGDEPVKRAGLPMPEGGLVIDYEVVANPVVDKVFYADETYYITDIISCTGTTTIQGGAVFKYIDYDTSSSALRIEGDLDCKTSAFLPAIFTAKDDNRVGALISGSTGNPDLAGLYGSPAIRLDAFSNNDYPNGMLKHARFSYMRKTIEYFGADSNNKHKIKHIQIVHSGTAVVPYYGEAWMGNVLVHNDTSEPDLADNDVVNGSQSSYLYAEHWSVNGADELNVGNGTILEFKNTLLVDIDTLGTYGGDPANVKTSSSPGQVFDTVGAGAHYLADPEPMGLTYFDQGTDSIDSGLRKDLKKMVNQPPYEISGGISENKVLIPRVQRDIDRPDLGYHYDAADYALNDLDLNNVKVTIEPGTVIVFYRGPAFDLEAGGELISIGSPVAYNRMVRYHNVQEQANNNWTGLNSWTTVRTPKSIVSPAPKADIRYTDFSALAGPGYYFQRETHGEYTFRDCRFRSGRFNLQSLFTSGSEPLTLAITNCLFDDVTFSISQSDHPMTATLRHCHFDGGEVYFYNAPTGWSTKDTVFDRTTITQTGSQTHGYNGYRSGYDRLTPNQSTDQIFTHSFFGGALGDYYLPGSSPLIDNGSQSASAAHLEHHTTLTTQTQEGSTQVDIGLHHAPAAGIAEIPKSSMTITSADPANDISPASNVIDAKNTTRWVDVEETTAAEWVRIDLGSGSSHTIAALALSAVFTDKDPSSITELDNKQPITQYEIYITDDPNNWGPAVDAGTWGYYRWGLERTQLHWARFTPKTGRYVVIKSVKGLNYQRKFNDPRHVSISEVWLYREDSGRVIETYMPAEVSGGASDDYLEDWGLNPSAFDDLKGNHVDVPNSAGDDQASDCCDEFTEPCDTTGDPRTVSETISTALSGVCYRCYVSVTGNVERQNEQFDVVSITLPRNVPGPWAVSPLTSQNYFFEGLAEGKGCLFMEEEDETRLIELTGKSIINVEFWPRDARFHKEAEAEIPSSGSLSFKDAFQPNPYLY